jgi:hypothetical protein
MGTPCTGCLDLSNDCKKVKTSNVIYNGPNLPCSNINTNDSLTIALQKLDDKLCTAFGGQTLQQTLLLGNIATDIGATFISSSDPLVYTEILSDSVTSSAFIKIDGLSSEYLMADGSLSNMGTIIGSIITNTITDGDVLHATSGNVVYDALAAIMELIVFDADIPVVLANGKTLGKYVSGTTIPAIGKTAQQVITDIALEYIYPSFNFFNVQQSLIVEVGTTLSGTRIFNWSVANNSGIVSTIDLYDNTAGVTLLAGTPNDGTQTQPITSILLNADGATQSWKAIANNTAPIGQINSNNQVTTARYIIWWGPVANYPADPVDGAANRIYANSLPNSGYKAPGGTNFILVTGTVENEFIVLLSPGVTIVSVIDTTNAGVDITANFILVPTILNDAGGTLRNYNAYHYTNAIPYSVSANLSITTT